MSLADGRGISALATRALDGKQLTACTGDYALFPKIKITERAERDRLFVQFTGRRRFKLFAAASDRFFLKVVEA